MTTINATIQNLTQDELNDRISFYEAVDGTEAENASATYWLELLEAELTRRETELPTIGAIVAVNHIASQCAYNRDGSVKSSVPMQCVVVGRVTRHGSGTFQVQPLHMVPYWGTSPVWATTADLVVADETAITAFAADNLPRWAPCSFARQS